MNRLSRCGFQCLLGTGCFLTLLFFDRGAYQTFREPKFLAMLWLAGSFLLVWGAVLVRQVVRAQPLSLPPLPLISLVPVLLLVCHHLWSLKGGTSASTLRMEETPLKIHYILHIILPAIAWLILFSGASIGLRSRRSWNRFLAILFVAFFLEVLVVLLEIIQNQTGLRVNPVTLLSQGEIEVFGQTVKERIFGTIGNPNWVAGYLAIALFPLISWTILCRNRLLQSLLLLILVASLFALVGTRSKGAFLAVMVGSLHYGLVLFISRRRNPAKPAIRSASRFPVLVVSALVFLALVGGFLMANNNRSPERDSYSTHWMETLALRGDSITVRALLAHCGFDMWEESPWLGLGPGEFKIQFLDTLKNLVEGPEGEKFRVRVARLHSLRATHLHNEYLQTLVEFGVIGLVTIELFFIWCQCRGIRLILESVRGSERLLRAGFLSGVWAGFGGSLFDYPFHRPEQTFLLAIFLGAAISKPAGVVARCSNWIGWPTRSFAWVTGIIFLVLSGALLWQAEAKYVAQRLGFWGRTSLEIQGGDSAKAFQALSKAQSLVPGEGEYTLWLAYYYLTSKGNPNLAVHQIRKARETSDNPNRVLLEATAQLDRNDLTTAARLIQFVEVLEPHRSGLQFLKGRLLQKQGRWEEACRAFLAEIQNAGKSPEGRSPNLEDAYLRLAAILEKELGQYGEAAKYYQGFLELLGDRMPSYPEAQLRLGDLSLNRFYDLENAEKYYREALDILKRNGEGQETDEVEKVLEEIQNRRDRFR